MRPWVFSFITLCTAVFSSSASAEPVYGDWVSPMGDAIITLEPCGDKLCGYILDQEFAPAVQHDILNPDPSQREREIIGLPILEGLEMAGREKWKGGTFYDPRTGKTYMPKIKVVDEDTVKISGCIGPGLCKGYEWRRNTPRSSLAREQMVAMASHKVAG